MLATALKKDKAPTHECVGAATYNFPGGPRARVSPIDDSTIKQYSTDKPVFNRWEDSSAAAAFTERVSVPRSCTDASVVVLPLLDLSRRNNSNIIIANPHNLSIAGELA